MKYLAVASILAAVVSAKKCQQLTIPVTGTARNGNFDIAVPSNNIEVTNFFLNLAQQGANYSQAVLNGYSTVSHNYKIAAEYCEPDSGPSNVLQVLTHGIGFDRSYWDLPLNNYNYSYVNDAVDQYGYSTFAYDRPGIGDSIGGDPLSVVQALMEVDVLYKLTVALRAGKVGGISKKYNKVVHVGHSYGSQHTYALTAMYPTISDGIALTGFSQNGSFAADFLFGGNFISANTVAAGKGLPNGYFAAGDISAVQTNFFAPGQFAPSSLTYAFNNGQPVTVGELLSFGGETGSINNFAGPVHIVTGERDIPYCGGNCLAAPTGYANVPSTSKMYLPKAKAFTVTIIPNAGHGLNFDYSHPTTYASINNYFRAHGLSPKKGYRKGGGKTTMATTLATTAAATSSTSAA